jgi:predicted transcriptional regulator
MAASGVTPLEKFLKEREIRPADLARESGYSRQHLLRVRMGRMEPTRRCIAAIAAACRRLSRQTVRAGDLFDLEGEDSRHHRKE